MLYFVSFPVFNTQETNGDHSPISTVIKNATPIILRLKGITFLLFPFIINDKHTFHFVKRQKASGVKLVNC